ncbi:response regulator [Limnoglobus roseus]|uniref:Response regulator n=1 Tax=Limnoglobus roseus TaxID=2598579 RepID=A0A5C1A7T8_9BACT|nr:response regulator [Limnoglobus roseus]QEL14800.1 response regulator [Limnoglobus roseus]
MKTILLIDDNRLDRMIHRRWLEGLCPGEYRVLDAESAAAGMEAAQRERVDCVLMDYVMLRENGLDAIRQMTSELPDCPPIILLSCAITEDMRRNAMALGAAACFEKPVAKGTTLIDAVRLAITDRQNLRERAAAKHPEIS